MASLSKSVARPHRHILPCPHPRPWLSSDLPSVPRLRSASVADRAAPSPVLWNQRRLYRIERDWNLKKLATPDLLDHIARYNTPAQTLADRIFLLSAELDRRHPDQLTLSQQIGAFRKLAHDGCLNANLLAILQASLEPSSPSPIDTWSDQQLADVAEALALLHLPNSPLTSSIALQVLEKLRTNAVPSSSPSQSQTSHELSGASVPSSSSPLSSSSSSSSSTSSTPPSSTSPSQMSSPSALSISSLTKIFWAFTHLNFSGLQLEAKLSEELRALAFRRIDAQRQLLPPADLVRSFDAALQGRHLDSKQVVIWSNLMCRHIETFSAQELLDWSKTLWAGRLLDDEELRPVCCGVFARIADSLVHRSGFDRELIEASGLTALVLSLDRAGLKPSHELLACSIPAWTRLWDRLDYETATSTLQFAIVHDLHSSGLFASAARRWAVVLSNATKIHPSSPKSIPLDPRQHHPLLATTLVSLAQVQPPLDTAKLLDAVVVYVGERFDSFVSADLVRIRWALCRLSPTTSLPWDREWIKTTESSSSQLTHSEQLLLEEALGQVKRNLVQKA
ncbi:uncharacterized protein BJ171DRAFT_494327 [Polychytrium aggregatum]|uniref:uncharacterized protein n=1 Tax=Polychytrium aggregatum TaxID=110093 RepID=UPI0022FE8B12|nr:uncharacterized protein BJ171DRAFT_494327 [Polychytrium aggregatum]KAI9207340.1 hypothetical protein BJ171DRAFT_494327 [Polychytrium aggregatum]